MQHSLFSRALLRVLTCTLAAACVADPSSTPHGGPADAKQSTPDVGEESPIPAEPTDDWLQVSTVSLRNRVSVPAPAARLSATEIVAQLKRYDPGNLLRCEVQDDPSYRAVVDMLGGVTWGYAVSLLDDRSQPELRLGPPLPVLELPQASAGDRAASVPAVEIEEADIVGLSDSAALFYSTSHGLLLVDLSGQEPRFKCAIKLPGVVKNFFYYREHLVALVGAHILHFKIASGNLQFIESIKLNGELLDTRRFNDKLVVYTRFDIGQPQTTSMNAPVPNNGAARPFLPTQPLQKHRALQVFKFGDKLVEELNQSLINTTLDDAFLRSPGGVPEGTEPGTVVNTAASYADVLWASDRYFVITEGLDVTKLKAWQTRTYQVCTKSHVVPASYRYCQTRYETRPNPKYVPPDNSGGDRACKGVTLADCLRAVASASNPTIEVPIGTSCEDREYKQWVCDAYTSQPYTYPELTTESATRLTIFEYTESGFVRLASKVREITTPALSELELSARVEKLTTSSTEFDLSVPGRLQMLYFQNDFLYAIANGVLQVYSMGEGSLVRTSSLKVANETLQSSLFSDTKLYLSDHGYTAGTNRSTLRVLDLTNPGFPKQVSQDRQLPGGHSSILATSSGIFTIGSVWNFENNATNVLKLGLFVDPFTSERAYLILGTDLASAQLGDKKAHYFDGGQNRLFLPYTGPARGAPAETRARIGVSHLLSDEIVSEGALDLPELIQRVRPRPGAESQYLSFGRSSIHWLLRSNDASWNANPVLAYYTPIALYRQNDKDDYVELSRLGARCQLRWLNKEALNARMPLDETASFECGQNSYPIAYGKNLLFGSAHGARFDGEGKVTVLSDVEIAELMEKLKERKVCLFSETPTDKLVDYGNLPPADSLKCYTPDEYRALIARDAGVSPSR